MTRPEPEPSAFPHPPGISRVYISPDLVPGGYYSQATPGSCGMTLRDYFAAAALMSMAGNHGMPFGETSVRYWAAAAYQVADGMMRARESAEPPGPAG